MYKMKVKKAEYQWYRCVECNDADFDADCICAIAASSGEAPVTCTGDPLFKAKWEEIEIENLITPNS